MLASFVRGAGSDAATLGNSTAALDSFLAMRIGRVFGSALVGLGPTAVLAPISATTEVTGALTSLVGPSSGGGGSAAAAGARSTIPADCVGTSTRGPVSSPEAISFTGPFLLLDEI